MPAQTQCPRCEEKATRVCGGCKNIMYCSTECQQTDWPTHKTLCKSLKEFSERPSADKCRVVAFLPGEAKPRFMWATLEDKGTFMTFDAQGLFPTRERYESKITIQHQAWTDTALDYEMNVYFTKRARDYYPRPNETVNNASGGLIPRSLTTTTSMDRSLPSVVVVAIFWKRKILTTFSRLCKRTIWTCAPTPI